MTKQASDEVALKCNMSAEEVNKSEGIPAIVDSNALVIPDANISIETKGQFNRVPIKAGLKVEKSRLGNVLLELYDIEGFVEPRKLKKVDLGLDLYQMEKV